MCIETSNLERIKNTRLIVTVYQFFYLFQNPSLMNIQYNETSVWF